MSKNGPIQAQARRNLAFRAYNWQSLRDKIGTDLEAHYIKTLRALGSEKGMLGIIFKKALNKIQDPAKLRRLIAELINNEDWTSMDTNVKGDAYEGLLEKNAEDVKSGVGQYFMPRALIRAIVDVMQPEVGEKIREDLLQTCDVHTLLRLPTGIFYAQGVKANVLFSDRMPGSDKAQTQALWIYDFRTNQNVTLRTNPLKREYLEDFVQCFNPGDRQQRRETERFRKFSYDELRKRDKLNLDIFWLRDENLEDSEHLPSPDVLGKSIIEDLTAALEQFKAIVSDLGGLDDMEEALENAD